MYFREYHAYSETDFWNKLSDGAYHAGVLIRVCCKLVSKYVYLYRNRVLARTSQWPCFFDVSESNSGINRTNRQAVVARR